MAPPCDDIPDFELIRLMSDQKTDFASARDAWGHFYVRHNRFLLRVCLTNHGYLLGMDGVKDIVQESFLRAFDRASTFDHSEHCETAIQGLKCRAWLCRIAENILRDRFRRKPEICFVDEDEVERLGGATDGHLERAQEEVPEGTRLKLLRSAFALLSEVEQTILRATTFWWQPNQTYQRMPSEAMEQLTRQTGKSSENIRQIRLRAMRKLENHVNNGLHNEKTD